MLATATAAALAAERFSFLAPRDGEMVVGQTTIRFSVPPGDPELDRIDVYVGGVFVGSALPHDWSLAWTAPPNLVSASIQAVAYADGRLLARREVRTSRQSINVEMDVVSVQLYPVVRLGSRYVSDLTAADFVVLEDGRPVEIESFAREAALLNVALVLDVSASMEDKLCLVQQAALRFLERLGPQDRVSIDSFDHAFHRGVPLTSEHARVREEALALRAGGGTALYDSLLLALESLAPVRGRKVLLLFSDGEDQRSITSLRRVAAAARAADVILYPVGSGGATELEARDDLRHLADESGGEAQFVENLSDLPRAFDRILTDVKAQYSLSFTPGPGPRGVRPIEVRTRDPRHEVRCRRSYVYD